MMHLRLSMDFTCCECEETLGITVECRGEGLRRGRWATAAAEACCPMCGQWNQVCFRTTGEVVAVRPVSAIGRLAQPSVN